MEIKGENFIKNVQLKQEKEQIEDRLNELEDEIPTMTKTQNNQTNFENELEGMNQNSQEFDDIVLTDSKEGTKDNKKKYIVLGLILIILFLVTVIVIRLFTNDKSTDDSFVQAENISQDRVLNNDNIEQEYQKILNDKLKKIENDSENLNSSINIAKTEVDELQIVKEISKTEQDKIDSLKDDIESVKTQEPKVTRITKEKPVIKEIKKEVKKPIVRKVAPKVISNDSKPSGSYVQIFALSKKPSNKLLNNIKNKGYSYILYNVEVKGKKYTKVLVGPYKNKNTAKFNLGKIKFDLDAPSAYIISF